MVSAKHLAYRRRSPALTTYTHRSMHYHIELQPHCLTFHTPATTSRGVYHSHQVWFIHLTSDVLPGIEGVGECAPLPDLSCDYSTDYERVLRAECDAFCAEGRLNAERLSRYPSILFGLETALLQLNAAGSTAFYDTAFSRSQRGIPINGLVWMGSFEQMSKQLDAKLDAGFRCIKLKIGAIDFEHELALLAAVRRRYGVADLELRVDANGAFGVHDVRSKLERLARFDLHSIEQPIAPNQWQAMAELCRNAPLPIALDEELIGINDLETKAALLQTLRPQYIILKPTLHGGLRGAAEWIALARQEGIGSWMTSALESNVGLNAIAQFAAHIYEKSELMPQGLGTGQLYFNNIDRPLKVIKDELWYSKNG